MPHKWMDETNARRHLSINHCLIFVPSKYFWSLQFVVNMVAAGILMSYPQRQKGHENGRYEALYPKVTLVTTDSKLAPIADVFVVVFVFVVVVVVVVVAVFRHGSQ